MSKKPSGQQRPFQDGDIRDLLKWLRDHGYEVCETGSGHLRISTGQGCVTTAKTPKDRRSVRNTVSQLRRQGVPI